MSPIFNSFGRNKKIRQESILTHTVNKLRTIINRKQTYCAKSNITFIN